MRTIDARPAFVLAISALWCGVGLAHIRIYPTESVLGVREKYTMRVPNEKQVATIRIEGKEVLRVPSEASLRPRESHSSPRRAGAK